jgi:hypothetical protein
MSCVEETKAGVRSGLTHYSSCADGCGRYICCFRNDLDSIPTIRKLLYAPMSERPNKNCETISDLIPMASPSSAS